MRKKGLADPGGANRLCNLALFNHLRFYFDRTILGASVSLSECQGILHPLPLVSARALGKVDLEMIYVPTTCAVTLQGLPFMVILVIFQEGYITLIERNLLKMKKLTFLLLATLLPGLSWGICTKAYFDNTIWHIAMNPYEDVAGVSQAGKMMFMTGFNKSGKMPASKYLYGIDFFEGGAEGSPLIRPQKKYTQMNAQELQRGCYVYIKISGYSPSAGYAFQVIADGFASMSMSDSSKDAPDLMVLNNAQVTYAGSTEYGELIVTRIK